MPRDSYGFFRSIATARAITASQRTEAWAKVAAAASRGATRPFCRAADGQGSLDAPVQRALSKRDWRFGYRKEARAASRARQRLAATADGWANATRELEASWATAAKEASEAWSAWYEAAREDKDVRVAGLEPTTRRRAQHGAAEIR